MLYFYYNFSSGEGEKTYGTHNKVKIKKAKF